MNRFRISLISILLGTALAFQVVIPASAVEVEQAPYTAADYLSAKFAAKTRNHRILIGNELTADSTTWVNADGTLTTESYGAPVRVKDPAGEFGWRDLNFDLKFNDDGTVSAKSGIMPLTISGGGSAAEVATQGLVKATNSEGNSFGFGWDGPLPVPTLEKELARFSNVLPDVDLLVRLDATGFEQFFEVKSKPTAETLARMTLLITGRDVTIEPNASGGFDFVKGPKSLGALVSPSVYDSAEGRIAPETQTIQPELLDENTIDLGVNVSFFERDDLVYPVIVDPAVTLNASFDTYVSSEFPTTDFQSSTELLVGTPDSGASKYRAFLNFPSTAWQDQQILSASLKLYLKWSWSCTPKPFTIYASTTAYTTTRWANQPSTAGGAVTQTAAAGYNSSCAGAYVTTDVKSTVQVLAGMATGQAGITLRASNESDSFGWKRFNSSNAAAGKPTLTVNYNRYPAKASTPTVSNAVEISGVKTVSTLHPAFSSKASDADGDKITLTFKSFANATTTTPDAILCSVTANAGVTGTCSPSAAMVDGQTYYVRVISNDGKTNSSGYSAPLTVSVMATEPTTPTITCPYANGYENGAIPTTSITCTITQSAAPSNYRASKVSVGIDDQTPVSYETSTDGSLSQTVSLQAGSYQHRIQAVAITSTGIQSPLSTHTMSFGNTGIIKPQKLTSAAGNLTISSYARKMNNSTPLSATIKWRQTNLENANWQTLASGLSPTTKLGLSGIYDYVIDLANLGADSSTPPPSNVPVSIDFTVCYTYPSTIGSFCTKDGSLRVTKLPNRFDSAAVSGAGPGQVSLTTGALALDETDFSQSIGFDSLSVSRSYQKGFIPATTQESLFGPNWQSTVSTDASMINAYTLTDEGQKVFHLDDGSDTALSYSYDSTTGFTALSDEAVNAQLSLTLNANTLQVIEADGAETVFTRSNSGQWRATCARTGPTSQVVLTSYTTDGLVSTIGYGGSSATCASTLVGNQNLSFTYLTITGQKRLSKISYSGFDPATSALKTTDEVQYFYTNSGILNKVTNLTNGLSTEYSYDSTNRLENVAETGLAPYRFRYDSQGRLVQVQRATALVWGATHTVDSTFVYAQAPSLNSGWLPNLPPSVTSHWGQVSGPTYAVATFDSQESIALNASGDPILPAATDPAWKLSRFYFIDENGRQVNTAVFGKNKWLYTASLLNADGAAVATFDSQAIEKVLDRFSLDGNDDFDELMYANVTEFATEINGSSVPSSSYVSDSWSPIRSSTDASGNQVTTRTHTSMIYDQNAPSGKTYGLVTTQTVGLVDGLGLSKVNQTQLSKTLNNYQPSGSSTSEVGWSLGQPNKVEVYGSENQLVSTSEADFNSRGQIFRQVAPGSDGADGRTTLTTYYSAQSQSLHPECGNKAQWEHLVCLIEPATSPILPKQFFAAYDYKLRSTVVQEIGSSSTLRTTTNVYLDDGRLDSATVTDGTTSSITTKNLYDNFTKQNVGSQLFYNGTLQNVTGQSFDIFGRQITSTNSLGDVTTTTYVADGQIGAGAIEAVSTPVSNTIYGYAGIDASGEAEGRALATSMTVSKTGTNAFSYSYAASYDQFGRQLMQLGPEGLVQQFTFNESNQLDSMSYALQGGLVISSMLTWLRTYDGYGRVAEDIEPVWSSSTGEADQTRKYGYDPVGRLASEKVETANSCSLKTYGYDASGNRTSSTAGNCTTSVATSHSFNSFGQITNAGYVYDGLGRNTLIAAVDAPVASAGAISLNYKINDQVSFISQGSSTTSYMYDALGRRVSESFSGVVSSSHYSDGSDNPAWVTQTGGVDVVSEIYTASLGSGLRVFTKEVSGLVSASVQLSDVRGNTVTSFDLGSKTVSGWSSFDAFGNAEGVVSKSGLLGYGAYGQMQRATTSSGLMLMGVRVYNPVTNQFTSVDAVSGGNEGPYGYPNDPVNKNDFSGLWGLWDTVDVVLTVASLLPVPGLQQIAWVGKAVSIGLKVSKLASIAGKAASFKKIKIVTDRGRADGAGVYEFIAGGRKYIGQSKNVQSRMAAHERRFAKRGGHQITDFKFSSMPGSTTHKRRALEQALIDDHGGMPCRGCNPSLWNQINSIRR